VPLVVLGHEIAAYEIHATMETPPSLLIMVLLLVMADYLEDCVRTMEHEIERTFVLDEMERMLSDRMLSLKVWLLHMQEGQNVGGFDHVPSDCVVVDAVDDDDDVGANDEKQLELH
jgi:hypothetical protein